MDREACLYLQVLVPGTGLNTRQGGVEKYNNAFVFHADKLALGAYLIQLEHIACSLLKSHQKQHHRTGI